MLEKKELQKEQKVSFLLNRAIAHRGLHDIKHGIPENSLLAFSEAIRHNYSIELDIHILKDGKIVVFHDDDLYRMTGKKGQITSFTYDEIKDLKLLDTNQNIPLFEKVLKTVDGQVPLIIEIKNDRHDTRLEEASAELLQHYKGEYAIKSFNPFSVLYFKKHFPDVIRGQLVTDFKNTSMNWFKKWSLKNMLLNFATKPDFISCDIDFLSNAKVQKARKNRTILGWTVRSQKELMNAEKLCDNIIFENIRP